MYQLQLIKLADVNSLEALQTLLHNSRDLNQEVIHPDWPEEDQLEKGWREIPDFRMEVSHLLSGTEEDVAYIYAQSYNERKKQRDKWFSNGELLSKEQRVNALTVNSIFFIHEGCVYAAPIMPNSGNINTFCDDLFPGEVWGAVERYPEEFRMSRDFFYWLLNCVTRNNGRVSQNIRIRSWTGYNGMTQDAVHRLTGDGERIAALLGTLAFLFTGDPFKALSLNIQYEAERIPLTIGEMGNVEINDYEYQGRYAHRYIGEHRKVVLTHLVYTIVLPELLDCYNQAILQDRWNNTIKEEFRLWVGETIVTRIREAAV